VRFWQAITVQRSDSSLERVDTRGGRLVVSDAARDAIGRLCRDDGRQAVLLCWPGGAACLPVSLYTPAAFDVIIGHVARCPIYVDVRQLRFTAGTQAVLDTTQAGTQRPLLRLRPAHPEPASQTAHRGGAAMTAAMSPQVAAWVSRELHHKFTGVLPEPVITACARDPVTDLHRSSQRRSTPGDSPSAPASERGDQLAARSIFGGSTHRSAAASSAKEETAMNNRAPTGPLPPLSAVWASSRERQIHNVEVDDAVAGQHLCGNLHLPTGRVCLLPERHRGGCEFTARPAR
jgi:hypothetical protein